VAPRVYIGPEADRAIERAVRDGGAELAALEDADAVVWLDWRRDRFPSLPAGVRWVQLPSAGVEAWMEHIAADGDRRYTSAGGVYAVPVAEHALGLLLAGVRGLATYARATSWVEGDDRTLEGSTVAIVGAGGIGRALIEMLAPHDVSVLAVTRRGRPVPGAARTLAADALGEVWSQADHFVIAAPATGATNRLVGPAELRAMPDHAWIVNIARGSLIDTDALVAALHAGEIGGAALDVTDPEPLPDGHPLWTAPNTIITPHVANPQGAMMRHLAERVRENVRRFAAGEDLLAPIDPEAGY
jgi:phosphoglycerate dehydrogenase-like enzyme